MIHNPNKRLVYLFPSFLLQYYLHIHTASFQLNKFFCCNITNYRTEANEAPRLVSYEWLIRDGT